MRINRSNPDQPAMQQPQAQPQAAPAAPKPAPKREPPKQEPPKPKKEKPKKKPKHEKYDEYEDDEEEPRKRRFPFGCLIVLILLALVGFGGYKVSQFYAELDGQGTLGAQGARQVLAGFLFIFEHRITRNELCAIAHTVRIRKPCAKTHDRHYSTPESPWADFSGFHPYPPASSPCWSATRRSSSSRLPSCSRSGLADPCSRGSPG